MKITKIKPAFVDDRGSICDLLTDENIQHAGLLESKKGSITRKTLSQRTATIYICFKWKN